MSDPYARDAQTRRFIPNDKTSGFADTLGDESPAGVPSFSLPGFEIETELGRGANGVVFRATHLATGRLVAIKVLLDSTFASSDQRRRFRGEAEAIGRLSHPNIIRIEALGEHAGWLYLVMEHAGGGSLDDGRANWPLPPREAADIIRVLARAIATAHDRGIVHRDLKPANVLLTVDGTLKIADFGLAKQAGPDGWSSTATGAVLGTPAYMAPEQADGRAKEASPAADIYALGAILYELLSGRPPFRGATAQETLTHVCTRPVPPLPDDTSAALGAVCMLCLRKDPADRYADATQLADDLDRYLSGVEVTLGRPELVAVTFVSGSAAGVAELTPALGWNVGHSGPARGVCWLSPRMLATAGDDGLIRLWAAESGLEVGQLVGHVGAVRAVAATPDASRIVSAGADGTVRFWCPVEGSSQGILFRGRGPIRSVAVSRDGRRLLASAGDRTIRLWDLPTRGLVRTIACADDVRGVAFRHTDGSQFMAVFGSGLVRLWDAADDRSLGQVGVAFKPWAASLAISMSGAWAAVAGTDAVVRVWALAGGMSVLRLEGDDQPSTGVTFSTDDRCIVTAGRKGVMRLWDTASGQLLGRGSASSAAITGLAWAPNRSTVASVADDGSVRLWPLAGLTK